MHPAWALVPLVLAIVWAFLLLDAPRQEAEALGTLTPFLFACAVAVLWSSDG